MAKMEFANCLVNIGGDAGNQVPKEHVSVAEMAVLRALHGDEAVHTIEPLPVDNVDIHEELDRINAFYGRKEENQKLIRQIFPLASHMPLRLRDLRLPEEFFAAVKRAAPVEAVEEDELDAPIDEEGPAPAPATAADDDFAPINDEISRTPVKTTTRKTGKPKDDIFG